MDFDLAAARLQSDQNTLRNRAKNRIRSRKLASQSDTKRAIQAQKTRQRILDEKRRKEKIEKERLDWGRGLVDRLERGLGVVRELGSSSLADGGGGGGDDDTPSGAGDNIDTMDIDGAGGNGKLQGVVLLEATSVYGQGDKITLPPSILSTLANRDLLQASQERGQPLFFRLGIPRSDYSFPSSTQLIRSMDDYSQKRQQQQQLEQKQHNSLSSFGEDDLDDSMMDEDQEKEEETKAFETYLEELNCEYRTYTYASVVEFTQNEGCIGLPPAVASALLRSRTHSTSTSTSTGTSSSSAENTTIQTELIIPTKRTIDPALASNSTTTTNNNQTDSDCSDTIAPDANDESKTPGHTAYGAFPVPLPPITLTLVSHLPLGTHVSLRPTVQAIQNGFYGLKDVKLALEQSLVRTRGCLNLGDALHCWFRGKKFDLDVVKVTPGSVGAVSCVNTDIEVDIVEVKDGEVDDDNVSGEEPNKNRTKDGETTRTKTSPTEREGGYRLADSTTTAATTGPEYPISKTTIPSTTTTTTTTSLSSFSHVELPIEPPPSQIQNVITIQIRGSNGKTSPRRRFDTTLTTVRHLFAYAVASGVVVDNGNGTGNAVGNFRLVTRFPRRVFELNDNKDGNDVVLNGIEGFGNGRELLLVEQI